MRTELGIKRWRGERRRKKRSILHYVDIDDAARSGVPLEQAVRACLVANMSFFSIDICVIHEHCQRERIDS